MIATELVGASFPTWGRQRRKASIMTDTAFERDFSSVFRRDVTDMSRIVESASHHALLRRSVEDVEESSVNFSTTLIKFDANDGISLTRWCHLFLTRTIVKKKKLLDYLS